MAQYLVTINMDNSTSVGFYPEVDDDIPDADFRALGGINPMDWTDLQHPPTSAEYALALTQGNLRWNNVLQELMRAGTFRHHDEVCTGITISDHQPSTVSFEIAWKIDPLEIYQYYMEGAFGNITAYDGGEVDTTERAIKQMVAAGICTGGLTGWTMLYRVHNHRRYCDVTQPVTIIQPEVPAKVFQDITVTVVAEDLN